MEPDRYDVAEGVLVVDGANVVGSRPDGWWRDRPGAAARLHAGLTACVGDGRVVVRRLVLVLEGRARPGVEAGEQGGVVVVHAPGSGDDEIVTQVEALLADVGPVTVVTADRGLTERVVALGASVRRPGWLLAVLDGLGTGWPVADEGATRRPSSPR